MKRITHLIVQAGFIIVFAVLGFVVAKNTLTPKIVEAQTCTTPAQVQAVLLTFPYCDAGGQCNFTQANCTWNASSDAASYQVTITNSTTSAQVLSQTIPVGTTNQVFSIENNNTYTCTVAAVNSCGTSGPTNANTLLCKVETLISPTVTVVVPTSTPVPPQATPPPTGMFENTLLIGLGTLLFLAGGLFLVIL